MTEETNVNPEVPVSDETSETSTPDSVTPIDTDQKILVGGTEYSARDLAEAKEKYDELQDYAINLEEFKEATFRLMNPETNPDVKKRDAKDILLAANYTEEQANEWVKIYDQGKEMPKEGTPNEEVPQSNPLANEQNAQMNDQILKMRAQMLQQNLESSLSSAIDNSKDGTVLIDWMKSNREGDDLDSARNNLTERVRAQTLENLRARRNYAGSFEDSWVGEEVAKATDKVAKDMLTVIGDPAKIGRVSETGEQSENLYRKNPVPLPESKGKTYGDVEGGLKEWTTDQLMRSLADSGEDSKL